MHSYMSEAVQVQRIFIMLSSKTITLIMLTLSQDFLILDHSFNCSFKNIGQLYQKNCEIEVEI